MNTNLIVPHEKDNVSVGSLDREKTGGKTHREEESDLQDSGRGNIEKEQSVLEKTRRQMGMTIRLIQS